MIQETLDYLLIRSFIACCNSKQIIESIDDEKTFSCFVNNVAKIMQEENFIFVSTELLKRVEDTIYEYRFDYNKNKEINDNMNYIIERIRNYKEMSDSRKKYIQDIWAKEECQNRSLPKKFEDIGIMLNMVVYDSSYLYNILSSKEFYIESLLQYLSVINFVLNKVTDNLEDDISFFEVSLENLKLLREEKFKRFERKMLESTINRLEDICTKTNNLEKNKNKTLKKTEK